MNVFTIQTQLDCNVNELRDMINFERILYWIDYYNQRLFWNQIISKMFKDALDKHLITREHYNKLINYQNTKFKKYVTELKRFKIKFDNFQTKVNYIYFDKDDDNLNELYFNFINMLTSFPESVESNTNDLVDDYIKYIEFFL